MTNSSYHIPVLLNDVIKGLEIDPSGVYVDVTYGGGGHSKVILENLVDGRLIAFDQDEDAAKNVLEDDRLTFIDKNFSYLKKFLRLHGAVPVDGILADLGVSSHQFNEAERGFSLRFDAELDMRMNVKSDLTATKILNEYEEEQLIEVLRNYGELRNARKIARTIVLARAEALIKTTFQLNDLLKPFAKRGKENKFYAQVYQALRIEVNDELSVLKSFLEQAAEVLKPGGRLVVISYHSLEDRLVKNYIKKGKFFGELEKDFYGNPIRPLKDVNRKVIVPTEEEIERNNRARSARLRIAEKL